MKKGFTLLELLAVIVVVAITALVVTPFVTNAINTAKKESFKNSMYGLIESSELFSGQKKIKGDFSETVLHSIEGVESSGLNFKYKGQPLKDAYLEINEYGKIRLLVWDSGFCGKKEFDQAEVIVTETLEGDCSLNRLTAPILEGGSDEWAPSRTVRVQTPPILNGLTLSHYQYYISTSDNITALTGGEWIDLEQGVSEITINTNGEYYVFMRGIDTDSKNGLTSLGEPVKIDTTEYDITIGSVSKAPLQLAEILRELK